MDKFMGTAFALLCLFLAVPSWLAMLACFPYMHDPTFGQEASISALMLFVGGALPWAFGVKTLQDTFGGVEVP